MDIGFYVVLPLWPLLTRKIVNGPYGDMRWKKLASRESPSKFLGAKPSSSSTWSGMFGRISTIMLRRSKTLFQTRPRDYYFKSP